MCDGCVLVVRMIEAIRAIGEYAMRDREQFLENLMYKPASHQIKQPKEGI